MGGREHGERSVAAAGRSARASERASGKGKLQRRSGDEKLISALRLLGELEVRDEDEIGCEEYSTDGGSLE